MEIRDHKTVVSGSDQSGQNFSGADFGESRNLTCVNFFGANLSGTSFSNGYLGFGEVHTKHHMADACYSSDLNSVIFASADLSRSNLYDCSLNGADLSDACVEQADLRRADCTHVIASSASFNGAFLSAACFDGADLDGATFVGAKCGPDVIGENTKYSGQATLGAATFRNASLRNADFSDADLRGVDFSCSNIEGACFDGANLEDVIFTHQTNEKNQ